MFFAAAMEDSDGSFETSSGVFPFVKQPSGKIGGSSDSRCFAGEEAATAGEEAVICKWWMKINISIEALDAELFNTYCCGILDDKARALISMLEPEEDDSDDDEYF
nr:hypothetical protein Iba_chr06dCG7680 [Ipomoea batatas]